MIQLLNTKWQLKHFEIDLGNLKYYTYPEYLQTIRYIDKGRILEYYNNFFKNYIPFPQCNVEIFDGIYQFNSNEVTEENLLYLYQHRGNDDKSLAFDDEKCIVNEFQSDTNLQMLSILDDIYSIKTSQLKCQVDYLNDKVKKSDSTVLWDLFLSAPGTNDQNLYGKILSYFDSFLIKPLIENKIQKHPLPYMVIDDHLLQQNQKYLNKLLLFKLAQDFCIGNYSSVLKQLLPGLVISGKNSSNLQKLQASMSDLLVHDEPLVRLTMLNTIANIITCKYSLDNMPCPKLGIHWMPQRFSTKGDGNSFGSCGGFVTLTNSGPEIYITEDRDTIAHEFSHFLDYRISKEQFLPWFDGDKIAENSLKEITKKVNLQESFTEYIAYGVTNAAAGNIIENASRNYKEIADWRITHVFNNSRGILKQAFDILCSEPSIVNLKLKQLDQGNHSAVSLFNVLVSEEEDILEEENDTCNYYSCIVERIENNVLPLYTHEICDVGVKYKDNPENIPFDLSYIITAIQEVYASCKENLDVIKEDGTTGALTMHPETADEFQAAHAYLMPAIVGRCSQYGIEIDL